MSVIQTQHDFDLDSVGRAVRALLELQEAMCDIFPEREALIQQLVLALLMREHVFVYGTYGTGKSDLVGTFFRAVASDPGHIFSMELSQGVTEAELFGVPNVKVMREDGILLRDPSGTLRAAYFAELDEFLDATGPLLRSTLGVLHERRWRRGQQHHEVPLRTAVASTNHDPNDILRRSPAMGAVLDRFIFWSNVVWLETSEARVRMFRKFLRGEQPQVKIDFADLDHASELVIAATDQIDPKLLGIFEEIVTAISGEWQSKGWRQPSDRTRCKWLQVAEAHALLEGRYQVTIQDFAALKWAACEGGHKDQREAFDRVVQPIIDNALANQAQSVDEVQLLLLEKLRSEIVTIPPQPSNDKLVELKRALLTKFNEVMAVKPKLDASQAMQREILATIQERIDHVQTMIDGKN